MDMILAILVAAVLGYRRVVNTAEPLVSIPGVQVDGSPVEIVTRREKGHNLFLYRDPEAFTLILRQFNLQ